jgi:hypothetical protein
VELIAVLQPFECLGLYIGFDAGDNAGIEPPLHDFLGGRLKGHQTGSVAIGKSRYGGEDPAISCGYRLKQGGTQVLH